MNCLEVNRLSFGYTSDSKTLEDISFNIRKGDYVTIVGPNGCGKSTLARILSGLLDPDEGTVVIDGKLFTPSNMKDIRPLIGIVFQNPDNQFIGTTVRDDIAFGLENHNIPAQAMTGIIEDFSKMTGVSGLLDKEPGALSGGQKQRVALAGVLAMKPQILILDEATSMIDPVGRDSMRTMFRQMNRQHGLTVISITHDPEEMLQSDDVIVIEDGHLVMHDKPETVLKNKERLVEMGLGLPFSYMIKDAFEKHGITIQAHTEEEIVSWLSDLTK